MKALVFALSLILLPSLVHAKGGHKLGRPVTSTALEDDVAKTSRLTFTFENDYYPEYGNTEYGSPALTYTTHGWDLGVSSQNVLLSGQGGAQNFRNDTYLNIAKTFDHSSWVALISHKAAETVSGTSTTIGTQTGLAFPGSTRVDPNAINNKTLHGFYFLDNDVKLTSWLSVHSGKYLATKALTNTTSYSGWLAGMQVYVWPQVLKVNMDIISGHSNVSGTVFQATWIQSKNVELFAGYGKAASNSGNYDYFILGVNLIALFK